jgi:hypothetical protein
MTTHAHRIRSAWPLYLVIAAAGAASIATSPPPTWLLYYEFIGPEVKLDPELREDVVPFTIQFSREHDWSNIRVSGSVQYENADEELRISLVEPGKSTLATQFQAVEGNGNLSFTLESWDTTLRCEPGETEVCEQELAVVFGTGGARNGVYTVYWNLYVDTSDDGTDPPEDLIFEVDFPRGTLLRSTPQYMDLAASPTGPAITNQ